MGYSGRLRGFRAVQAGRDPEHRRHRRLRCCTTVFVGIQARWGPSWVVGLLCTWTCLQCSKRELREGGDLLWQPRSHCAALQAPGWCSRQAPVRGPTYGKRQAKICSHATQVSRIRVPSGERVGELA